MKCLSISYDLHNYVGNVEKLQKDLNNIYLLLARIPYNSYSGNFVSKALLYIFTMF